MNLDYSLWYGGSEMQRDLSEIRDLANEERTNATVEMKAKPSGKKT
ncbi:MAG TPA: hypothetical protein VMT17_12020 [Anaeromyxobacteraceae bacterium]|nr:hypothetical protein [Anaeromyxobacteraceae bacterium]